jgi:ADP-ribosylglycohydrolase
MTSGEAGPGELGPTLFTPPPDPDMSKHAQGSRASRTIGSALWAAYGDALGFISELTDESGLRRRTRGAPLELMPWRRLVGGRQGAVALLPTGCYSDDTQLRLSTGRALSSAGFDIEAFSKVELTVWPSYALGGGVGTKAAATNLSKEKTSWYANTHGKWTESGGNGAAMRIQPHVWSAADLDDPTTYAIDVVRNSICTHASPVGIAGAVLHAMFVANALSTGQIPSPEVARSCLTAAREIPSLMKVDNEVGSIWMPLWERDAGRPFAEAWDQALLGAENVLTRFLPGPDGTPPDYQIALEEAGLYDPSTRGGGVHTAIAAIGLLWSEPRPLLAVHTAARAVGSDTDTIATMAGAVIGAVSDERPSIPVLDAELIEREANRLALIAEGETQAGFDYPDLLHWTPPRTQADAYVLSPEGSSVAGLGPCAEMSEGPLVGKAPDFQWRWVRLAFGQTLLIKCRTSPTLVEDGRDRSDVDVRSSALPESRTENVTIRTAPDAVSKRASSDRRQSDGSRLDRGVDLDQVLSWIRERGLDEDSAIGYAIRRVARDGTPEQLAMLVGLLRAELREPVSDRRRPKPDQR